MQVVDPEGAYEYREVTDDKCGYVNSIDPTLSKSPCDNYMTYWVSEKGGDGSEFGACNLHVMSIVETCIGPFRNVALRPVVER